MILLSFAALDDDIQFKDNTIYEMIVLEFDQFKNCRSSFNIINLLNINHQFLKQFILHDKNLSWDDNTNRELLLLFVMLIKILKPNGLTIGATVWKQKCQ